MEKIGGQWPSLAPTNSILQHKHPNSPSVNEHHSARSSLAGQLTYLGDTKKPPLSAPRQDRATKKGTREANPCRARLANVCR